MQLKNEISAPAMLTIGVSMMVRRVPSSFQRMISITAVQIINAALSERLEARERFHLCLVGQLRHALDRSEALVTFAGDLVILPPLPGALLHRRDGSIDALQRLLIPDVDLCLQLVRGTHSVHERLAVRGARHVGNFLRHEGAERLLVVTLGDRPKPLGEV